MTAKVIMVQGTASSVGKSILVAALCRIMHQDGYRVAPFKAQNMALNSFVTKEGGEIGRAQVVQAEAAGIEPSVHMNPVLLKPEADSKSQVIVLGKLATTLKASQYYEYTPYLLGIIENSLNYLRSNYDIVVIEGAGSPAEINLKEREIVNMRIARLAGAPVILVGDIDRGGVFASLVGTLELLTPEERELVRGFIINKFRGDVSLLKPGLDFLEQRTGKTVLGVVPYFRNISIAQEDSVYLDERRRGDSRNGLRVAIIRLPHISNYDDFDPLEGLGCQVDFINHPSELTAPDLIIIPGTKSTSADLQFLREQGLAETIIRYAGKGTPVIGICGGYQMLGERISDPLGMESSVSVTAGLGLLPGVTTFEEHKTTTQVKARILTDKGLLRGLKDSEVTGYEIHMGQTDYGSAERLMEIIESYHGQANAPDGAVNQNGLVFGTYLHGLFHNEEFARGLLNNLRELHGRASEIALSIDKEKQYNALAQIVRQNLNIPEVYKILTSSS